MCHRLLILEWKNRDINHLQANHGVKKKRAWAKRHKRSPTLLTHIDHGLGRTNWRLWPRRRKSTSPRLPSKSGWTLPPNLPRTRGPSRGVSGKRGCPGAVQPWKRREIHVGNEFLQIAIITKISNSKLLINNVGHTPTYSILNLAGTSKRLSFVAMTSSFRTLPAVKDPRSRRPWFSASSFAGFRGICENTHQWTVWEKQNMVRMRIHSNRNLKIEKRWRDWEYTSMDNLR
jgi:hypothetical protein